MPTIEQTLPETAQKTSPKVMLADGNWVSLTGLNSDQLCELQWEQEQLFARAMQHFPPHSRDRTLVIGQAYDTICTILAAQQTDDEPFVMGFDKRYGRLVLDLLHRQVDRGIGRPRLFEIGYGSGALLRTVGEHGFPVGGVEISNTMRDQALAALGPTHTDELLLGDLRSVDPASFIDKPSLVYWNDVFEHICPDEITSYLKHIHNLLLPGGTLVTITPNWLLRPSDVTRLFCPLRTEARGLHLKEYRLTEVVQLLKGAGFKKIATPLMVSRRRIYVVGGGLCLFKQLVEPLLDRLPVDKAHLLCRGMGLSMTIATK